MADLNALLTESTEEVLENMFFSGVMGEMEEREASRTANGCARPSPSPGPAAWRTERLGGPVHHRCSGCGISRS